MSFMFGGSVGTTGATGPTGPTGPAYPPILPIYVACGGPGQPKCSQYWWQIATYILGAILAVAILSLIIYLVSTTVRSGRDYTMRSGSMSSFKSGRRSHAPSSYSGNACSSWI